MNITIQNLSTSKRLSWLQSYKMGPLLTVTNRCIFIFTGKPWINGNIASKLHYGYSCQNKTSVLCPAVWLSLDLLL